MGLIGGLVGGAMKIGGSIFGGIKASQAGTELNAIYTRLSVNTSHALL